MYRKITLLIAMLLTLSVTLSGCKGEETETQVEQGKINEVEILADEEKKANVYAPYTEISDDLGYTYKTVKARYMGLQFKVPEEWDVSFVNGRIIKLQAPDNDPHVPGVTSYIECIKVTFGEYETVLPFQYEEYFEYDYDALAYNIDGTEFYETFHDSPEQTYTTTELAEDTSSFSFIEYDNVSATKENGYTSAREIPLSSFHFNFDWSNQLNIGGCNEPLTLRSLFKTEVKENVRPVLTHIASSFKGFDLTAPSTRTYTINGVTLSLPEEFEIEGNIASVPNSVDSYYAGMYVGVFDYNIDYDNFDGYEYAGSIAEAISDAFIGKGFYNSTGAFPYDDPAPISINGKNARYIESYITYHGSKLLPGGMFLRKSGDALLRLYDLSDSGVNKQIAFWFPDLSIYAAENMSDLIVTKTIF